MMLLFLEHINKGFGKRDDANYRPVLNDLSLQVEEGEQIAILGPSGSGKTTLLNLVGGLDTPDEGVVKFRGEGITGYSGRQIDQFRNRQIGFVFQFHHLLPQCTLLENILIPTLVQSDRSSRANNMERAETLMKRVGIWEFRNKLPGILSGGECQRAAVVRAMINAPSILLADEPTGALDSENVEVMSDLLLELNREDGLTLILVTHSIDLARKMGRTLKIKNGKLQQI
jgi:ABC-type lipoprotein export system ATPase subunit